MNGDDKLVSDLVSESSLEKSEASSKDQPETSSSPPTKKTKFGSGFRKLIPAVNIYTLLFLVVFGAVLVGLVLLASAGKKANQELNFSTQELSTEALQKLRNTDASVGDAQQTLTIAANAVFNNKILVRGDMDVAGTIKAGSSVDLPGITVTGQSNFNSISVAGSMSVVGTTTMQGPLVVQQSLNVSGDTTVSGSVLASKVVADSIQFNQNLSFQKHIDAGGATPTIAATSSVGSGGTVSINGTDTNGTVTINTGSSPVLGIMATITFKLAFSETPRVLITPVGASSAGLQFYVTRTTTGFSIGTTSAPLSGTNYVFDFFAAE